MMSIVTVSPSATAPSMSALATRSTTSRWITRFKGRAPKTGSKPSMAIRSAAAGATQGLQRVGDQAVGGVRSRDFRISGTDVSFLIGGTEDPERIFLALCDSRSHEIILSETGTGFEALDRRLWRTDSLYGRDVYLKIVDASPDGHLNLDEILESGAPRPAADAPFPGFLFAPYPNPSNGGSTVVLRLDRSARVDAEVCGPAGNRIRNVFRGSLQVGFRHFHWDGKNDGGQTVPAGVYFFRVEAEEQVRSCKIVLVR